MRRGSLHGLGGVGGLRWLAAMLGLLGAVQAFAGGSRIVPGVGWGVPPWYNTVWFTGTINYYTDPGPLNSFVDHAQADAMVWAAASVWNVPTSSIGFQQGGQLAEHASTANVSFNGNTLVLPADLQISNENNIPVAIVYDPDGSLIDLLLGEDASEPYGCRQNAVVGDIDDVHQNDGSIRHATLILNGRCVGAAPEQLTQMQYQLTRAFGRVLGMSWSQTNDNVFTAQGPISGHQVAFWPLMHPLDVICGNYTYQCMSNPFQPRVDDLNTLAQLYPIAQGNVPAGKQATSDDSLYITGTFSFPNGQGMDWVNITTRRENNGLMEDWQTTSALTGVVYQQAAATPVNDTPAVNAGWPDGGFPGIFLFRRIPLDGVSNVFFTTEAVNPLYTGDAAVGPYVRPPATPSGSPAGFLDSSAVSNGDGRVTAYFSAPDAASSCDPGADGTEDAPATLDASGWQKGLLCGAGHNSWWSVAAAAGHSWTVEVTATDETGAATGNKAQPVMGAWATSDPLGVAPTVNIAATPFNSLAPGMTQMQMTAADTDQTYRFSVSDQYGAGRPDFIYVARVLYAAAVTPVTLGTGGGQLVITGMGFRKGNQVLVNGVPARVRSWSATSIVADAPPLAAAGAQLDMPVDIAVFDPATNGVAAITAAVSYHSMPNLIETVGSPAGLETQVLAREGFTVRVVASDGVSPIANAAVVFTVVQGGVALGLCQSTQTCLGYTDSDGLLTTSLAGDEPGTTVVTATEVSGGATVQLVLADTDPERSAQFSETTHYLAAGASATSTLQFTALQDLAGAVSVPVTWTASTGLNVLAGDALTQAGGVAMLQVSVSAAVAGAVETVTGCAWGNVCSTWTLRVVDPAHWVVSAAAGAAQAIAKDDAFQPIQLFITDGAGHLLEGAPVHLYQRVLGWEGSCAPVAHCPAAPVLASQQRVMVSDAQGALTLTPMFLPDIAQVVEVAASTGSQGFLTLTLVKAP